MDDLIKRLEQAHDRPSTIAAFEAVAGAVDVPEDFRRHVEQARRSGSGTRAMGYLLLAALTLVPEGLEFDLTTIYHEPRANVGLNLENGPLCGVGATPALALCIASLKALQAEKDDG